MPVDLDNEDNLVRMTQAGSIESFVVLVDRYEQRIYRLSYAITKNAEDAEDVLRETFLKACDNIRRFKGESRFYTWLVRIAMGEVLTKLRRRHVPTWVTFEEAVEAGGAAPASGELKAWPSNPEHSYSGTEFRAILSKALEDLETPLRVVFTLRDIEGLSDEETAGVSGLSATTVKTLLLRARLQLRGKLSLLFQNPSVVATG